MELSDTTDFLLYKSPENAGVLLAMADRYIRAYNESPDSFILPAKHEVLLPLIERYANNLGGFVAYIKAIRDSFATKSEAFGTVHKFYRTINTRLVQQVRRERMAKALDKAVELYGDAAYPVKHVWALSLEKLWARRRLAWMDQHRKGVVHLDADVMAELLAEFWDEIDNEIEKGERIPKWE